MESRKKLINAKGNKKVHMGIIPGHFATNHSHINHYVDLNSIKTSFRMAREAAKMIAEKYTATQIDTIICLEGTETLGAFLAQELADSGIASVNADKDIDILTPEINSNGQIIFRDDAQKKIWNKQVLLLISSASTGWSIERFARCLDYYSGKLAGVSALFSAIDEVIGIKVDAIFTTADIPDYNTYLAADCPMCKSKQKIDALVNAFGYSKL
ncbi:MAG: orotate phosphoribosyltransferase [Ruminiclostridium sp.]|nr:orotate phosphoribosyltransferase [Ruminiclostridium sp.]